MTRVQWISVLALVTALSYGLMQSQEPVRGEQLEAVQAAVLPAPTYTATMTVSPSPTLTLLPTATPLATATTAPTGTQMASPTATTTVAATSELVAEPPPTETPVPAPLSTLAPPLVNPHPEEPRFVFVDQYNQRLMIFEQGALVRDIPCSTGLPESDKYTPLAQGRVGQYWGTFTSFGVEADDAWYLYKSSGSILIHSLPYTRDEANNKLYQDRDALGVRPSSHGCIRIAPEDAAWLTAWNPEGALFEVTEPYLQRWFAPQ